VTADDHPLTKRQSDTIEKQIIPVLWREAFDMTKAANECKSFIKSRPEYTEDDCKIDVDLAAWHNDALKKLEDELKLNKENAARATIVEKLDQANGDLDRAATTESNVSMGTGATLTTICATLMLLFPEISPATATGCYLIIEHLKDTSQKDKEMAHQIQGIAEANSSG
jgi:hypothetical protein